MPVRSKPAVFTSTKVPKFIGVTSWDQYRQVFEAIVRSNGWDDCYGCSAAFVSSGGRHVERGRIGPRSETDHSGTYGTLWVTGPVGALSTPVIMGTGFPRQRPQVRGAVAPECCYWLLFMTRGGACASSNQRAFVHRHA